MQATRLKTQVTYSRSERKEIQIYVLASDTHEDISADDSGVDFMCDENDGNDRRCDDGGRNDNENLCAEAGRCFRVVAFSAM